MFWNIVLYFDMVCFVWHHGLPQESFNMAFLQALIFIRIRLLLVLEIKKKWSSMFVHAGVGWSRDLFQVFHFCFTLTVCKVTK